jgi:hypothetical protein
MWMLRWRWLMWIGSLAVGLTGAPAGATQVTLESDVSPSSIGLGSEFTVTIGLDDVSEIRAYTLDVVWSGAAVELVSAAQLACGQAVPGTCSSLPFTVDPMSAPPAPSSARAGVLILPPTTLFLDGRTNDPAPDPRSGLFSLTFRALALGSGSITAGLLDERVDGVIGLDDFVALDPESTTLGFEVVPEPGTATLLCAGALGLGLLRRRGIGSRTR